MTKVPTNGYSIIHYVHYKGTVCALYHYKGKTNVHAVFGDI